MKRIIVLLALMLIFTGCGTAKKATKTRTHDTEQRDSEERRDNIAAETSVQSITTVTEGQTTTKRTTETETITTTVKYAPPDSTGIQAKTEEITTVARITETEESANTEKVIQEDTAAIKVDIQSVEDIKTGEVKGHNTEISTQTERDSTKGVARWTWLIIMALVLLIVIRYVVWPKIKPGILSILTKILGK